MMDIDNFKQINDDFGHNRGDIVLQDVAMILQRAARRVDLVGRWGGEEFVLVLADTNAEGAQRAAEKLRLAIARHRFETGTHGFNVTASFGVAQLEPGAETEAHQLIARADRALYVAKRSGRNRVHVDAFPVDVA
jgi:diguanylate cyclase (GGDEF)-like protein